MLHWEDKHLNKTTRKIIIFLDMQEAITILILYRVAPKDSHLQFSKAPIMGNFGELPFGEIPEPLKYVRPFRKISFFPSFFLIN